MIFQKIRDKDESIRENLQQYGLAQKYLDVMVMDSSHPHWREGPFLDAIITDRKF